MNVGTNGRHAKTYIDEPFHFIFGNWVGLFVEGDAWHQY